MAAGLGNPAIADKMVITEEAVHKRTRNIFAKLGSARLPATAWTAGSPPLLRCLGA
ncbi:hypothetical protein [Nonomuraea typhae]|uniref:hypothetical protein n=1 Tax=Nonomuraea typhae TaxID=2603600 RepID=UPI003CCE0BB0